MTEKGNLVNTYNEFAELLDPKDPRVKAATDHWFEKAVQADPGMTWERWEAEEIGPYVYAIERLKKAKKAAIIGHNYMDYKVSFVHDYTGDSLLMGREAASDKYKDHEIIVNAGVVFMGETAKTLNPDKKVLQPSMDAGCSLAASITPEDVDALREKYPGVPIVNYANTYVGVRGKSDVLCTSSNIVDVAIEITKEWGTNDVILAPDKFLARNTAIQLKAMYDRGEIDRQINVIDFDGSCQVHELYDPMDIRGLRAEHPGILIVAHPECPPEVIKETLYGNEDGNGPGFVPGFSGSTSQMQAYVAKHGPKKLAMITDCGQGAQIAMAYPETKVISNSCQACPHMKQITLKNIFEALLHEQHEITMDERTRAEALKPLMKMEELISRAAARKAANTDAPAPSTNVA